MDDAVAGRIVDPAAAKLHPFWKFGTPTESRYAFRNGKSIASTAIINQIPWNYYDQDQLEK